MIDRETLIRNMDEAKRINSTIMYNDEEFANCILGRRNLVGGGMVLGSPEWPMDPKKRIRGMILKIWPF